jgi:hypothetical protein
MRTDINCSFCSCQATGFWSKGDIEIFLCSNCAKEILPALYADTIYRESAHMLQAANKAVADFLSVFWRALFLNTNKSFRERCLRQVYHDPNGE